MSVFLAIGALLVAGALLFIVPPLLRRGSRPGATRDAVNAAVYRDQLRELESDLRAGTLAADQYEKARSEIEARLLADIGRGDAPAGSARGTRAAAVVLGLAVPICALAVYVAVGNPRSLAPQAKGETAHGLSVQQFEALVSRLATRLKDKPEDAEGWMMLGRSYAILGRFPDAARAYSNAAARKPRDAQLLADYADALAMAQGRLQGEPEKIIAGALAIDPQNVKALGKKPGRGQVRGVVKLAPGLAAKVAPEDTVFIFARAEKGPRMPLAVLRRQGRDLPAEFTLDDSMAMSPAAKLSNHPRVVIGARVSKSANATAQAGDLQGLSAPVRVGAEGVNVVIDTELREPAGK